MALQSSAAVKTSANRRILASSLPFKINQKGPQILHDTSGSDRLPTRPTQRQVECILKSNVDCPLGKSWAALWLVKYGIKLCRQRRDFLVCRYCCYSWLSFPFCAMSPRTCSIVHRNIINKNRLSRRDISEEFLPIILLKSIRVS